MFFVYNSCFSFIALLLVNVTVNLHITQIIQIKNVIMTVQLYSVNYNYIYILYTL